jgi:hypothetical protein
MEEIVIGYPFDADKENIPAPNGLRRILLPAEGPGCML